MNNLRKYLEEHLSVGELRDLIDEMDENCQGKTITSRTPPDEIVEYLEGLSRDDLREVIDYINDGYAGDDLSQSGSVSELANRIVDEATKSIIAEVLDDLDLNGLPDKTDKSGDKLAIVERICDEFDESLIEECLENLGFEDREEDDDEWAEGEDGDDDDGDAEWDEDFDDEPVSRNSPRRTFDVEPLRFSDEQAKKGPHPYQVKAIEELKGRYKRDNVKERGYLYVATGGGKTRITNDFIMSEYIGRGKCVLWITHHSLLLYQAARDLVERHGNKIGDIEDKLGYFASESKTWLLKSCLDSYKEREFLRPPQVLYTTWHSLDKGLSDRRSVGAKKIVDFKPELVVIDEAHWGKGGALEDKVYSTLFDGAWSQQNILGLSATPKVRFANKWNKTHVGNISFPYLVGIGYLSRPVPVPLELHSGVQIRFDATNRITNYAQIGRDKRRNQEIVQHYQANRAKYGKTLFFACNNEHADLLGSLLRAASRRWWELVEKRGEDSKMVVTTQHLLTEDLPHVSQTRFIKTTQAGFDGVGDCRHESA